MIDTHAHLFYKDYDDQLDDVMERAADAGVTDIICVGLDLPTNEKAVAIAEKYDNVWATVGVHPHDAGEAPAGYLKELESLASHAKVVAIGEMGLDFFRNLTPPDKQVTVFRDQLDLAKSLNMPAIIHSRAADDGIHDSVTASGHFNAVVHCFSSEASFAENMIEIGLHLSFTGTVTFGKNHNEAALKAVGIDRVMVETDCPYLAPVPKRGKTNEPSFVAHTVGKIAEICGHTITEVDAITTANARTFFGLPVKGGSA